MGLQGLEPSIATFPDHNQGAKSEVPELGLEPVSLWYAGNTVGELMCYATAPTLVNMTMAFKITF